MNLADKISLLSFHREEAAREKYDAEEKARRAARHVNLLDEILAQFRTSCCTRCNGYGRVRIQYAQDEIRTETCEHCKGTGEATT